jgi:RHS repeat-associated protein
LTDRNKNVTEEYSYDAWGKAYEGEFANGSGNLYGFTGQRFEPELGVYGFAFREYSPKAMRWMTEDPIKDGTNWYQYCNEDPVNRTDPLGLECSKTTYSNNGTITEKTTTTNPDGSITEKVETSYLNGSVIETTTTKNPDSSVTTTSSITNLDGSSTTTTRTTEPDGSSTSTTVADDSVTNSKTTVLDELDATVLNRGDELIQDNFDFWMGEANPVAGVIEYAVNMVEDVLGYESPESVHYEAGDTITTTTTITDNEVKTTVTVQDSTGDIKQTNTTEDQKL